MSLAAELLTLRLDMGMSRREFSDYYTIPYRTVSDWETGKRQMPEYLFRLMQYKACAEKMLDNQDTEQAVHLHEDVVLEDELEHAKKRDHKIWITDEAIKKVPKIRYKKIQEAEYDTLHNLAQSVLRISKDHNDSNEVALTYRMDNTNLIQTGQDYIGISLGSEHNVDPLGDTISYHLIHSTGVCAVVLMHNHPSLSNLSLAYIQFFLLYSNVKLMIVVTNLGAIYYLVKGEEYDYLKAIDLFNLAMDKHNRAMRLKDMQEAADYFLRNCHVAGITYDDR